MAGNTSADLSLMREFNESLVLNLIRQTGRISRTDIASHTHLSRSTVSSIVNDLLAANLVCEVGTGHSRGGRRPIMIEFNGQAGYVIGVDLGATHLMVLLSDLEAQAVVRVASPFVVEEGPKLGLERIAQAIEQALQEAGLGMERIFGVGIGVPGPLDFATGKPIFPPIMPGWHDTPIRERLRERLNKPVYLDNDANLGAIGEYWWGGGRGARNVAFIKVGTGIGCGLIIEGQIYRGEIGSAGEIGHTVIDEDGPPCRCGSAGCLETLAAAPAILHVAAEADPALASNGKLTILDLIEAAQDGHLLSRRLFAQAGRRIGTALTSLVNLLNPGIIVIGGGVARAGPFLLDPLRETVQQRALPVAVQGTRIVESQLGADAIAIGAVTTVLRELFSGPDLAVPTRPHVAVSQESLNPMS
ncbi:MAG: ROK family transcriptional regulator [Chloroflexia bacterium]|nr:ROK family transcriptional regulator [Chloroflexia bacterium]